MLDLSRYEDFLKLQASRYSVCPTIHPNDHLLDFLIEHPAFPSPEAAIEYYFADGAQSRLKFLSLIATYLDLAARPKIFEFASGFGMVSRHLANDGDLDLLCCDIHPEAITFIQDIIGAPALLSSLTPETLACPSNYDAVFALSFFSHMPISTWCRWLVRLTQVLRPGGVLIFTTHGDLSRSALGDPAVPDLGFWFAAASEQTDLSVEQYGSTLTTETFVRQNVATIHDVELVDFQPGLWWSHQDMYVLKKL